MPIYKYIGLAPVTIPGSGVIATNDKVFLPDDHPLLQRAAEFFEFVRIDQNPANLELFEEGGLLRSSLLPLYRSDSFELVALGITPEENAEAVRAAVARAKLARPGGEDLGNGVSFTVIVPPGYYKFMTPLVLDTDGIDLVALVSGTVYFDGDESQQCVLHLNNGFGYRIRVAGITVGTFLANPISPSTDIPTGIRISYEETDYRLENVRATVGCAIGDAIGMSVVGGTIGFGGRQIVQFSAENAVLTIAASSAGSLLPFVRGCDVTITGTPANITSYKLMNCRLVNVAGLAASNGTTYKQLNCYT